MKSNTLRLISLCLFLLLLTSLGGCGSAREDADMYYSLGTSGADEAILTEKEGGIASSDSSYTAENSIPQTETKTETTVGDLQQRKMIYTVSICAQTEQFDNTVAVIEEKLSAAGGYIENAYRTGEAGAESTRYANYTLRVPTEQLDAFLDSVSGTMTVSSQNKTVDDVTAAYTDIESRLATLRTEQSALQELLAKADTVENILLIRNQLTDVTADIEAYEAQIRTYDSLISYSTVELTLDEVRRVTVREEQTVWGRIRENFTETLYGVGDFFVELFIFLVSASPVLVVLAVVGLVIFFLVRACVRRRRKKARKAAAADGEKDGGQ